MTSRLQVCFAKSLRCYVFCKALCSHHPHDAAALLLDSFGCRSVHFKNIGRLLERNLQCHNRNKAVFQVVFAIPVNVTVVTASAIVMYYEKLQNYSECRSTCKSIGAVPLVPFDEPSLSAFGTFGYEEEIFWVGVSAERCHWQWDNGPFLCNYDGNFSKHINQCASFRENKITETPCNSTLRFVCKKSRIYATLSLLDFSLDLLKFIKAIESAVLLTSVFRNKAGNITGLLDLVCPEGWKYFNGDCYIFYPDKTNYYNARMKCDNGKGYLTTAVTKMEREYLENISEGNEIWLGMHESKKVLWKGEDGNLLVYHLDGARFKDAQQCLIVQQKQYFNYNCSEEAKCICSRLG
ncbi:unnamed protein product [Enterobius vermicularis]|uniref:C-type lectin domain-containing protein n=1 Tax=Enterobius vermicularis TaxID=51028 RepID=A0A0N4USQ2_ENTVE|nr:unnamed protein product [Enterobius vermicularis]